MKLETFFEKFDLFADAPDAVSRMRELVLEFAVAGRLLPRDGAWETRDLKSLATKIGSGATPAGGRESYVEEGIPLIRSMNVHFRGFDPTGLVFLSDAQADQLSSVTVQANDVLLNITGASIGRVTIAPERMSGARVNQHVTIIRTKSELYARFLSIFLASPSIQRMIDEIQVGATRQALTKGMIEKFEIPLPPLAEQKRIVAKVDELMTLCDRLEAQQQEREKRHAALTRASLARFAGAPTPTNLNLLFHSSFNIPPSDLRKSILTLAVQGKLVPQDPNDEQQTLSPSDQSEDAPHDVPPSWQWVDLAVLAQFINGDRSKNYPSKSFRVAEGVPFINAGHLSGGDVSLDDMDYITEEHFDRLGGGKVQKGDVLYCLRGSLGKCAVVSSISRGAIASSLLIIRPKELILASFLHAYLGSPLGALMIARYDNGSAQPNLSAANVKKYLLPLPPVAEQRRIVAKVEQLMALVDALETQLAAGRATAEKLLSALVAELTGTKSNGKASKPAGTGRRGRPRKSPI